MHNLNITICPKSVASPNNSFRPLIYDTHLDKMTQLAQLAIILQISVTVPVLEHFIDKEARAISG